MNAQTQSTDRRQLIIDAARKLFATRPYDQVTTSDIAKNAGVAYGLIAHHFDNKRGLYLAVMNEIAEEIAAAQTAPAPPGASLVDRLRHALRAHITHIDSYSDSFVALLRGALGADSEHQSAVERLRWLGAQRILSALGVAEPIAPTLRTAMHGWIGFLDEMMIDRITHRDVDVDTLAELAATTLATALRTAAALDSSIAYTPEAVEALKDIGAGPN
ncbi:TetR family transcriptional regulator [Mycolicibacterium conceptionense]|uniref:TetR family transcriptional regulator n=1 Tax=Mycolicibacterium conceptionense TaxID=451644 RepID=A0A1A1WMQ9_9MYCO|nr:MULTISPECIES: TetR/AcrR family transcriptional regulator [Mycolicibacterium]MCW1824494.1 TetR/AcrR family transcriptional regulator [Mycolicibacterium senegalense]OBB11899.1 TetR family transcriptional regulator [Mycolicibacterium conceptionense]OBF07696.1 TetR family transcriptional regulator [Mycolicibacterium conceptionense]OBF13826.1 TetR family transcriptional regulator [Mycolicibacterium conceptionense]OBF47229.1 TetR family transcriptional regulator [Mycolicibacterium conceptionense]